MENQGVRLFVQDVCRQFQPCTWTQTSPTPGLILTVTRARNRTRTLWEARGRQGQSRGPAPCFGGVSPKKHLAAERPALTNETRILHSVLCCILDIYRSSRKPGVFPARHEPCLQSLQSCSKGMKLLFFCLYGPTVSIQHT